MRMKFICIGQSLRCVTQSNLVANTVNYIGADFDFKTEDWALLDKWAHFVSPDGETHSFRLVQDSISESATYGLNLTAGAWDCYVTGVETVSGDVAVRVTTNSAHFLVNEVAEESELGPMPTQFETLIAEAEEVKTEAQLARYAAISAMDNAEDSAKDAEAWAVGQRGGVDVSDDDETYHNNAKYYTELYAPAEEAREEAEAERQANEIRTVEVEIDEDLVDTTPHAKVEKENNNLDITLYNINGDDGFSPTVTVTDITGGHRVTITDAEGAHVFDVMDGQGGSGGTSDYAALSNKPKINSHELAGNQSASDLGLAPSSHNHAKTDITDLPTIPIALSQLADDSTHRTVTDAEKSTWNAKGTYSKPSGGIPDSDLESTFLKSSDITGKEDSTNKVTSISPTSTDTEYPSAKCVFSIVGDIESALAALR